MSWTCNKCGTKYAGKSYKSICSRCRKDISCISRNTLKTKDKDISHKVALFTFGIDSPVPEKRRSEIRRWSKLHEKNNNLVKKDGQVRAKMTFYGGDVK